MFNAAFLPNNAQGVRMEISTPGWHRIQRPQNAVMCMAVLIGAGAGGGGGYGASTGALRAGGGSGASGATTTGMFLADLLPNALTLYVGTGGVGGTGGSSGGGNNGGSGERTYLGYGLLGDAGSLPPHTRGLILASGSSNAAGGGAAGVASGGTAGTAAGAFNSSSSIAAYSGMCIWQSAAGQAGLAGGSSSSGSGQNVNGNNVPLTGGGSGGSVTAANGEFGAIGMAGSSAYPLPGLPSSNVGVISADGTFLRTPFCSVGGVGGPGSNTTTGGKGGNGGFGSGGGGGGGGTTVGGAGGNGGGGYAILYWW